MWLRVGDINNNGKTYIGYWADFWDYRQYAPYRYAQKGKNKDWLIGDVVYGGFDWNLLRKGESISSESLNHLATEIVKFYEEPVGETGKTIDEIIKEPLGGAHRNFEETAQNLKEMVVKEFKRIDKFSLRELLRRRYDKYRKMGEFFEE